MSKNEDKTVTQEKVKGRPKKEVDVAILKNLCEIQCTVKEMAYVLGVSVDTLNRNYKEDIAIGKTMGKVALRRAQFRNAVEKNNITMQIWLGKQILNQADAPLDDDAGTILPWTD